MAAAKEQATVGMSVALNSWKLLNDFLRDATEEQCKKLLGRERDGKGRVQYLLRIHARYNKVRADRERRELLGERR